MSWPVRKGTLPLLLSAPKFRSPLNDFDIRSDDRK